jgi:hypothetical protein
VVQERNRVDVERSLLIVTPERQWNGVIPSGAPEALASLARNDNPLG